MIGELGAEHLAPLQGTVARILSEQGIGAADAALTCEGTCYRSDHIDIVLGIGHPIIKHINTSGPNDACPQLDAIAIVLGEEAIKVTSTTLTIQSAKCLTDQESCACAVRGDTVASINVGAPLTDRPQQIACGVVLEQISVVAAAVTCAHKARLRGTG
ncbi:MAG: hypothetical protein EBV34_16390, partial [Betaproteobacteria bacterium]|nr:hypothetical protein [Betaproteobacteria bacterium]